VAGGAGVYAADASLQASEQTEVVNPFEHRTRPAGLGERRAVGQVQSLELVDGEQSDDREVVEHGVITLAQTCMQRGQPAVVWPRHVDTPMT
jgi:hypothetical protein